MSISLDQLERKVDQMVAICASLRSENQDLRAHVASLEAEKAALTKKIDITRERLEGLMDEAARRMSKTLEIKLLGKDYRVACKPEEREGLLAAVALLDGKLTEAGDKAKGNGERVAVMVALNLAHEFLVAKDIPEQLRAALEQRSDSA
jgi:uncharacterized protein (TIGR02449 family)